MMNSLASSSKAWRVLQSLIGRVMAGSKYNQSGKDDIIKLPTIKAGDHPFKARREGNRIRFSPGLVLNSYRLSESYQTSWEVTDEAFSGGQVGYEYTGQPVFLYVAIQCTAGIPQEVTANNSFYTYMAVEPQTIRVLATPSPRKFQVDTTVNQDIGYVTFIPPDSDSFFHEARVPICYVNDNYIIQLIDKNICVTQFAAHRNLYLWP
jgi:hypothetical protein